MIHDSHYYEQEALEALEESKDQAHGDDTRALWIGRANASATLALAAATLEANK